MTPTSRFGEALAYANRIHAAQVRKGADIPLTNMRLDDRYKSNEANYAGHIWDRRDANGHMGATACIVIPRFADALTGEGDWQKLAWWIHDHLPYSDMEFYPNLWAFNLTWHEVPKRRISSYVAPRGVLTKPGMENHEGSHAELWAGIERAMLI